MKVTREQPAEPDIIITMSADEVRAIFKELLPKYWTPDNPLTKFKELLYKEVLIK